MMRKFFVFSVLGYVLFVGPAIRALPPTSGSGGIVSGYSGLPDTYQQVITMKSSGEREDMMRGTHYLYDEWMPAIVRLAGDTIMMNVSIRIDLLNLLVEFKDGEDVRLLPSYLVSSARFPSSGELIVPRKVVNASGPAGFYSVVYAGEGSVLYRHFTTAVLHANYNPITGAGRKTDEIEKQETLYLMRNEKLVELERKKSSRLSQIDPEGKAGEFIRKERLNVGRVEDLVAVLKYLDMQH